MAQGEKTGFGIDIITTKLEEVVAWGRANSMWPMPMGISCCAIEMMAMVAPRFDLARFGAEAFRFTPRQSDLMIVAGTVNQKMAPVVRRIYDQMAEPKWVIAMGACLCTGGMFDNWNVVQGLDHIIPVDVYVPGCPPRPEAVIDAIIKVQNLMKTESMPDRIARIRAHVPDVALPNIPTPDIRQHDNTILLNMGPQHPSTHGVLRVILELDGETVLNSRTDVGFLHRSIEKHGENLTYHQFTPYTDKLDYLAPMSNNLAYMLAVEKLFDIEVPRRAQYLRTIGAELARISAHLLSLGTFALDVGAATVFFYTFQQRELIYDLSEEITGARMNTDWTRLGGVNNDLQPGLDKRILGFLKGLEEIVADVEGLLSTNRIWINRNRDVGAIRPEMALGYGITGPILRASGVPYDLRKDQPYMIYNELEFDIPIGEKGDCYDRYWIRMEEIRQSIRILRQVLGGIPEGSHYAYIPGISLPPKEKVYTTMEELIYHFKTISDGPIAPEGEVYHAIEAPKGELGFFLTGNGTSMAHRLRIKSPSFTNLQLLDQMLPGCLLSDVVPIIASLDPVMGECDR